MDVIIIDSSTGRVVATYPIILQGSNYTPSEQEYFSEAWRCAVADEIVDADRRDEYSIEFARQ